MADAKNIPLVADLDGTLIRTDMMWESLSRLLRRNPFAIFQILFWWTRGRALLKQKLAARVTVDPAALPLNEKFLAWLREEKANGRKIILATASDLKMAQPIAERVGLFDEVLASDGKTNLRSENKLRALTEKFGERGFDYAGNSDADFAVWRGSRQAVVVNASPAVLREAANCTQLGPTFCEGFSHFTVAKSVAMELFWRSGYLIAMFAGLLLAVAFPKFSLAGFAWLAPAVLAFAAHRKSGADAFRVGCVGGFAFWLASLYWLLLIPVAGFPILGWVLLSAYCALFFGAWTWLIANFKFETSSWFSRTRWAIGGAAAWTALELFRGWFLTGFPWSFLACSQYKLVPLLQISAVTGVFGVSFLVIWFSLALFSAAQMILQNPNRKFVWQAEIFLPLTTVLLCYLGGFFWMNRVPSQTYPVRLTSIQPSVPQSLIWSVSADDQRFADLLARSRQALTNRTDILLWPEAALPRMIRYDDATLRAVTNLAYTTGIPILLASDDAEPAKSPAKANETAYYNAAFLINESGQLSDRYCKQKLVIFGEYVPLLKWLPFLKWFTPIEGGFTPGTKPATFGFIRDNNESELRASRTVPYKAIGKPHNAVLVAPLICFEDTFPASGREATTRDIDLLINLTNDGWFGDSAEQWQHLANSVFRAVENGVPLVRCCNNGITCWVDAHGRVQQIFRDANGSEYQPGAITFEIPVTDVFERPGTFYHRHGNWFAWGCVGLTLLTWLRKVRRQKTI